MVDAFAQLGFADKRPECLEDVRRRVRGRIEAVQRRGDRLLTCRSRSSRRSGQRTIGLAELAAGDPTRPTATSPEALAEFDRINFREPAIWRVDGDAIEAATAVGDVERARALDSRGSRSERNDHGSLGASPCRARCRGLVLAARGRAGAGRRSARALVAARALPDAVRAGAHVARPGASAPPAEAETASARRRSSKPVRSSCASEPSLGSHASSRSSGGSRYAGRPSELSRD